MSTTLEPTRGWRAHALRIAEAATTPLVPADFLDLFAPLRPGAELRGRIESVHPETADAATLVIRPGADWAGHVPGQYVRIGIDVDGVRHWRAYSLTHGPRPDGRISITVKAVPDGKVSHHIVRHSRPGTLVHLEQAAGEFVLPVGASRREAPAPVRHRRLRHHPGDRDAAQPLPRHRQRRGPPAPAARRTTSPWCTSLPASPTRSSSATSRPSTRPAASASSRGSTTSTASSTSPTSSTWCPTSTSVRRSPAAPAVCSTPWPPTTRSGAPALRRAVPGHDRSSPARAARSRSTRPGSRSSATAPGRSSSRPRTPVSSCRAGAGWASATAACCRCAKGSSATCAPESSPPPSPGRQTPAAS